LPRGALNPPVTPLRTVYFRPIGTQKTAIDSRVLSQRTSSANGSQSPTDYAQLLRSY